MFFSKHGLFLPQITTPKLASPGQFTTGSNQYICINGRVIIYYYKCYVPMCDVTM